MSYTPSISSAYRWCRFSVHRKTHALGEVEQSIEFCPDQLSSADQLTFYRCLWQKVNTDQAEFDSILRSTIADIHKQRQLLASIYFARLEHVFAISFL